MPVGELRAESRVEEWSHRTLSAGKANLEMGFCCLTVISPMALHRRA